jgi:hypothetical protein
MVDAQAQAKVSSDIVDVDSELVRSTRGMQTCMHGCELACGVAQHTPAATIWVYGNTDLFVVVLRALNARGAWQCFNVALSMPLAADDAATLAW